MNHAVDQLAVEIEAINQARAAAGRDGVTTLTVSGTPESLADLDRYRAAGVDRLIARPFTSSRDGIDGIRRFGEEIITRVVD